MNHVASVGGVFSPKVNPICDCSIHRVTQGTLTVQHGATRQVMRMTPLQPSLAQLNQLAWNASHTQHLLFEYFTKAPGGLGTSVIIRQVQAVQERD